MPIAFNEDVRNAMLQAIADAIDDSGAGLLAIYDGTRPETGADITTEVKLAEVTFSSPSVASISGGVLTFDAIADDTSANASGTATWARITNASGNFVADLDVGGPSSGAHIQLSTTTIVAGALFSITAASITAPGA